MPGRNYAVGFYFVLLYNGEKIPFQEISGLAEELATEDVTCGGENRFKFKLPTVASSQNLVLKRAVIPASSKIVEWCKKSIGGGFATKIQPANITVNLLDASSYVCMKWVFYKAYPIKYSFSDLKSQENSLVIETMELAYTYFDVSAV